MDSQKAIFSFCRCMKRNKKRSSPVLYAPSDNRFYVLFADAEVFPSLFWFCAFPCLQI